jgi:CrcB protein
LNRHRFGPGLLAVIALGGAAGTVARAAIEQASPAAAGAFPWATFGVNIVGSLVLGLVVAALDRGAPSRYLRPLLGAGLCGGFTTFSTFAVETDSLVRAGRSGVAVIYAVASIATGLLAVWVGAGVVRFGRRREA